MWIERRAQPGFEDVVVQRAQGLLGMKYNLLTFNCEHLANFAAIGVRKSQQVERAVGIGIGVGIAAWLFRMIGSKSTYDPSVDRNRDPRTGRFKR